MRLSAVFFRRTCGALIAPLAERERLVCHRRRAHSTKTSDVKRPPRSMGMSEEEAFVLAEISEALFKDEAEFASVTLPECGGCGVHDDSEVLQAQLTPQDNMDVALDPQEPCSSPLGDSPPLGLPMREMSLSCLSGDSSTALAGAVSALMTSDASLSNRAASELLLTGSDIKALFPDGTLRGLHIEQKCLSQCDFSAMSFLSVHATRVDFSRSLFYTTALHDVVFVGCCFDGCVMKELRCTGNIQFDGCSFRFSNIALRLGSNGGGKTAARRVVFHNCDFDLTDFKDSDYIPAQCFTECYNTHLAAKFPPQVKVP